MLYQFVVAQKFSAFVKSNEKKTIIFKVKKHQGLNYYSY